MAVPVKVMPRTPGEIIKFEMEHKLCREVVTVLSGQNLVVGAVIGRRTVDPTAANTTAALTGGNTGNGTITKDATAPVGANAWPGIYSIVFIAATKFEVFRPDGTLLGVGTVGTAFDSEVKFSIAAGGTPFAAGDRGTVTVPEGDKKVVLAPYAAANNGSHRVCGVLAENIDATGGDKIGLALARGPSIVAAGLLVYEAGYDDANKKATANAALKALGIMPAVTA